MTGLGHASRRSHSQTEHAARLALAPWTQFPFPRSDARPSRTAVPMPRQTDRRSVLVGRALTGSTSRRRSMRTSRTREGSARRGQRQCAMTRGSPNPGRRVALNEVGLMLRGRGSERRPWLDIALEARICGSPRMAGRSACLEAYPSVGSGCGAPRRVASWSSIAPGALLPCRRSRSDVGRRSRFGDVCNSSRATACGEPLGPPASGRRSGSRVPQGDPSARRRRRAAPLTPAS